MDRFDRAADDPSAPTAGDERLRQLAESLAVLAGPGGNADRAERIQKIFSDAVSYDDLPYPRPS